MNILKSKPLCTVDEWILWYVEMGVFSHVRWEGKIILLHRGFSSSETGDIKVLYIESATWLGG